MSTGVILVPEINIWTPQFEWPEWMKRRRDTIICASAVHGGAISYTWSLASMATSYTDLGGLTQTYEVGIFFQVDGTVDVFREQAADLLNEVDPYVDPTSGTVVTWVRCTWNSGDDMTSGNSRGTWHQLNTARAFVMTKVSSGGPDEFSGNFDFELSSESDGTPVEASKLSVTVNVGEIF
jgi:hypothetical protein